MRLDYERKLKETIEQLLSRSLGYGKVRAQVTVEMDFDRVTTSEERFDPDSQVARSTQLVEETQQSNEGGGVDPVRIANNLPEAEVPRDRKSVVQGKSGSDRVGLGGSRNLKKKTKRDHNYTK